MKNYRILLLIGIVLLASSCKDQEQSKQFRVIPLPQQVEYGKAYFELSNKTNISAENEIENSEFLIGYTQDFINKISSVQLSVNNEARNQILFCIDEKVEKEEGYELDISETEIKISAKDSKGIFYGVQSLIQLVMAAEMEHGEDIRIATQSIKDYPQFPWRVMLLDCGRHFFDAEYIKKFIDCLALYKINYFNWHLTQDQGWRIEIDKYPKLTEVAAWRIEEDGSRYGGFYTKDEIREVVEYAKQRNITIIPEIEFPGHCTAALFAYPEFGCTPTGPKEIPNYWGVMEDVYNPAKEETYAFLQDILDEVMELFPGEYINIGGDECPTVQWKNDPLCQKKMKELGLKHERELQDYMTNRLNKYIESKGRKMVAWNDVLQGENLDTITVMAWWHRECGLWAAEKGHNVIMAPGPWTYFDKGQGLPKYESDVMGLVPMDKVYAFDIYPDGTPDELKDKFIGAEGCAWTEHIATIDYLEFMVFPRLMALSEVLWTKKELRDYDDFMSRLSTQFNLLNKLDVNYRVPPPKGTEQKITFSECMDVVLEPPVSMDQNNGYIVYTLDGSDTDKDSKKYEKPFEITDNTWVKARFVFEGKESPISESWYWNIDKSKNGLNYKYFEGQWRTIPDFGELTPIREGKVHNIDLDKIEHIAKHYGVSYTGKIKIEKTDKYHFYVESDDGVALYIDGESILGIPEVKGRIEVTKEIDIEAGTYDFQLDYFDGGYDQFLEIGFIDENKNRIPIDPDILYFE